MQVDHLDSQAQCKHEGCTCKVPEGERYCSDHCRKADQGEPTREEERKTCACRHGECADGK
ncbi:MAG: hypothetical protein ACREP2_09890 [Rhodanobacteraceae bacterium]